MDGVHAGEVDDAAPALLQHAGQAGARKPDGGVHVDVDDALPLGIGHLEERLARPKGGVVHEHVDGAEGRDRLGGDPLALPGLADIAHDDERLDAKLARFRGDALAGGFVARTVDRDVEAVGGEAEDAGTADVPARSRDER